MLHCVSSYEKKLNFYKTTKINNLITQVLRFEKFTHIQISFLAFQKEFLKSPNGSEVILQVVLNK
ncbi:hypothetical protein MSIBF_A2500002 [groundwater metagenome]|uniref:Uncharacterized protein n=1 Tax=groundwater metagenome TaxID=717931 RepID=A0A098EC38_9ZZZZ